VSYHNIPLLHRDIVRQLGPRPALRYKHDGLYHDISWNDYRRQADRAAAGLLQWQVHPGDRIGILSENRHEWLTADLAILSLGAVDVPMHAPLSPAQVQYQLSHSGARGVIVSNQAQADKITAMLDSLPDLEFLISFDPIEPPPRLQYATWPGLIHRGAQQPAADEIAAREAELTRDSLATIIYTSGTTGHPKGVMLTHGNLVSNAEATCEVMPPEPNDVLLSWLPYSHIYARTVDHYLAMLSQVTTCLAESIDSLMLHLAALRPTWMTAVPRFYEKVWSAVEHLDPEIRSRQLQGMFGGRMRRLTSGGAPLPRHVCQGLRDAGLPLLEGYGLTESSPVISFNHEDAYKIGSVGRALPGVEVRIAEDGEILTRGPHVMAGYWNNPEATAETIRDGWLYTGDVGYLDDDGYLFITDRKKDLIITSGGKNVAPSELERLLTSDPFIDQAVVYGDGKPCITALIVPNFEKLKQQTAELDGKWEPADGFIESPVVHKFLAERVETVMQAVSRSEQVREFLILGRPFQMEADELTASMKVRRRFIIDKYRDRLDALYEGGRMKAEG
jgi:long-chain acyl-CoA synthetase